MDGEEKPEPELFSKLSIATHNYHHINMYSRTSQKHIATGLVTVSKGGNSTNQPYPI